LRLPSHPEVIKEFGFNIASNHHGETSTEYSFARFSVLYDLLNDIGLDAKLAPQSTSESALIPQQFEHLNDSDVVIWDRGLTGFPLMAQVRARGAHFIGRCGQRSFFAAQELLRTNRAGHSQIVKVVAAWEHRPKLKELKLPVEMVVRFVSLRLPTGDLEVLVTSLLDEKLYPTEEFLEVYHWRWNHETYHQMLKSRLDLENWTGHTVEAVKQDVYAAIFVSNLESLLSQEVQEELSKADGERKHPLQVNRAVSYHALKEQILNLLYKDTPVDEAITHIQTWMRSNPVAFRQRKIPRPKPSVHRSYTYQRNLKKSVF
jgi:hypothetical protein